MIACACAIGMACGTLARRNPGSSLPTAGSPRDDGSGLLAGLSMGPLFPRAPKIPVAAGTTAGAARYGGATYGGASYGGATYAGYVFRPSYDGAPAPNPYAADYTEGAIDQAGAIRGRVTFSRRARAAVPPASCAVVEPTLPGDGPAAPAAAAEPPLPTAVVMLTDIRRGRAHPEQHQTRRIQAGGVLELRNCRLEPSVQLMAPIGSTVALSSTDAATWQVSRRSRAMDGAAKRPWSETSRFELEGRGARHEQRLDRAGVFEFEASGQRAWVVVAAHPYYATTDERGAFRIDDVPPGVYRLAVWRPGTRRGAAGWSEPVVTAGKTVTVRDKHISQVALSAD